MELILEISTPIYSFLTFILFGWSEAFYWHYFTLSKTKLKQRYEHGLWTYIRFLVHIPIGIYLVHQFNWFAILGVLGLIATSFFMHDGSYYYWRNKLDGSYPKTWRATSATSTAKFTLEYSIRQHLLIWGLILITFMFLSKYIN